VNINKATVSELSKIQLDGKPLGKIKAKAIVSYRNAHKKDGGFQSLDELKKVNGFKKLNDDQLKTIQDQLTV
jgi:competence ComEA-like helix-hairpin-helix protein